MTTEPGIPELPEPPAPVVQPPPLPPRLEIEEVSQTKRKWILELHPDHIALHSEFEPRPWVFTRGELWDKLELMRIIFLIDAVWFAVVAARNILSIIGGSSKWWLLFSAWLLLMAFWGLKWFAHFGPMNAADNHPQPTPTT